MWIRHLWWYMCQALRGGYHLSGRLLLWGQTFCVYRDRGLDNFMNINREQSNHNVSKTLQSNSQLNSSPQLRIALQLFHNSIRRSQTLDAFSEQAQYTKPNRGSTTSPPTRADRNHDPRRRPRNAHQPSNLKLQHHK